MTNGSLMEVESIAECSLGAFCNMIDLHSAIIGLENQFLVFFLSGHLKTGFTVSNLAETPNKSNSKLIRLCKHQSTCCGYSNEQSL